MLVVHRSSKVDDLVDILADVLASTDGLDPFTPEVVATQSAGMRRWLSHRLSEALGQTGASDGVCANVRFVFPGQVIREVVDAATGGGGDRDPWRPERLAWTVAEALPDLLGRDEMAPLASYLDGTEAIDRRTYGLCRRIADLFDRYAL